MPKVTMECRLGEKDGLELTISVEDCPNVYYAVPNLDDERIRNTKGNDAKRKLRDELGCLAYQFCPEASSAERFVMMRNAALDKARH